MKSLTVVSSNVSSHFVPSLSRLPLFFYILKVIVAFLLSKNVLHFICHVVPYLLSYLSSLALCILHNVSSSLLSYCFIHACVSPWPVLKMPRLPRNRYLCQARPRSRSLYHVTPPHHQRAKETTSRRTPWPHPTCRCRPPIRTVNCREVVNDGYPERHKQ